MLYCCVVPNGCCSETNFLFSNVMRLRDFIKHVYVDRRYSGDKNVDKPPRAKSVRFPESFSANFSKMYM